MHSFIRNTMFVAMLLSVLVWGVGCELDGGGGGGGGLGDVGDNNPNVYVSLGDSITDGNNGGGAPYPPRLASMTGKTVYNMASQGESAAQSAAKLGGILADKKPAAVLFMTGAVDLIGGQSVDAVVGSLRSIIEQSKANKSVPVMATLTPMLYSHSQFEGSVKALNNAIRSLASSEGARLVDLESKFGDGTKYILDDGLHPNEEGNQLMADAFKAAL